MDKPLLDAKLVWRLHNEPVNEALGPCECPVCRPDLQPCSQGTDGCPKDTMPNSGHTMCWTPVVAAPSGLRPCGGTWRGNHCPACTAVAGPTPEDVAKAVEQFQRELQSTEFAATLDDFFDGMPRYVNSGTRDLAGGGFAKDHENCPGCVNCGRGLSNR